MPSNNATSIVLHKIVANSLVVNEKDRFIAPKIITITQMIEKDFFWKEAKNEHSILPKHLSEVPP
ncbi:hypothetical protein HNQ94_001087 [Salirhabdus euzebyi]|uniref:Uncharacterized protein n=1 Tax=Salirhabdus euzebyi TaxID=394506 RepID=A0A841PZ97_9BACI|nr:hypothetical protein [Salirhabdus euzebyi]MBB6452641.1 hypothetical protein [Salirhabdus euzebyi]